MKKLVFLGAVLSMCMVGLLGVSSHAEAASSQSMYRVYNPNSGEHFYTASDVEKSSLLRAGWKDEGTGWVAPTTGDPVYRLYNKNAGDHHYTLNAVEKDSLVKVGWEYEGVGWYSATSNEKRIPLYRQYNPNAKSGTHNYTTSKGENDSLVKLGWKEEGLAWYAVGEGRPIAVEPRKADENITTVGGGEGANPGSYRLIYSNKPFDTNPDGSLPALGTPTIEFSAHFAMNGSGNDFGVQMVIAGNGEGSGQVGLDTAYQEGTSVDFSQGRTSVKTVNFPAGSGVQGQQYYATNTSFAGAPKVKSREYDVRMQYFDNPGFVTLYIDGKLAGAYNTKLSTNNKLYTLHLEINDESRTGTLQVRDLKVLRDGKDVTSKGSPPFVRYVSGTSVGTSVDLKATSHGDKGIHGNF